MHAICAARLAAAEAIAEGATAVVFSGESEADLMHEAWTGPVVPLLTDHDSRTTAENARAIAAAARELGATQVVAVTSSWHSRRAAILLRAALDADIRLEMAPATGSRPPRLLAREAACYAALPVQLRSARKRQAAAAR